MREIRRRTRVVGAFPDGECALNLAAAGCGMSPPGGGRRGVILNMNLLKKDRHAVGMKRLARVPQEDGRHPHLRQRRSPDLRASDDGSGGMASEIHTSINEGN